MTQKEKYSIGDVSRICNISRKALRYYDKIGLITTQRKDYNNYRYYTHDSLLSVPIIKYYKQMGFKLDEMQQFIEGSPSNVYRTIQKSFLAKIAELEKTQQEIHRQYVSVNDWYNLILEAEQVIDNVAHEVSIKYVEPSELLFLDQTFENDIKASIINIDFTNFVESIGNKITGPVMLNFSSFKDRMQNKSQKIRILQKTLLPVEEKVKTRFGGHIMVGCYHIGSHETISETYAKMCRWLQEKGYQPSEESYERYVTDYWTTSNSAQFVTEVLIRVSR